MPYIENNKNNNLLFNEGDNNNGRVLDSGLFLLAEAAKQCSYSQEYLSLLARRGELQAIKKGRNWYTTLKWLREYVDTHPAERRGNFKGELYADQKMREVLAQSMMTEPLENHWRNFYNSWKEKYILIAGLIKSKTDEVVKKIIGENSLADGPEKDDQPIDRKQYVLEIMAKKLLSELDGRMMIDTAVEKLWGEYKVDGNKIIRRAEHYPFRETSNGLMLEMVCEKLEEAIVKVKLSMREVVLNWIISLAVKLFLNLKETLYSLGRSPKMITRHWGALDWWCRLQYLAVDVAVIVMAIVVTISFSNANFTNEVYVKSAGYAAGKIQDGQKMIALGSEDIAMWSDGFYNFLLAKKESFGEKILIQKNNASGQVAGVMAINKKAVWLETAYAVFDNVNNTARNMSQEAVYGDGEKNFYFEEVFKKGGEWFFGIGKDIGYKKEAMARAWARANIQGTGALALSTGILTSGSKRIAQSFCQEGKNKINIGGEIKDSYAKLAADLEYLMTSNNSPRVEWWRTWILKRVVISITHVAQLRTDKIDENNLKLLAERADGLARKQSVAFRDYLYNSQFYQDKAIDNQMRKYTKLNKLFGKGLAGIEKMSRGLKKYFDALSGRTENKLGDVYLALLDTLNLQPAYSVRPTGRTLIGDGDMPLELSRNGQGVNEQGLAVIPLEEKVEVRESDEFLAKIKETFSDEVDIVPAEDNASGMIKPANVGGSFEEYLYVVVPLKNGGAK